MTLNDSATRRTLLRTLGAGGLLAGTGTSVAAATQNDGDIPVQFEIYPVKGDEIDNGKHREAPFSGIDDGKLFDPTGFNPTGNTVHHQFRFTPWELFVGNAKPYPLIQIEPGIYSSRGQTVTFTIDEALMDVLEQLLAVLNFEIDLDSFLATIPEDMVDVILEILGDVEDYEEELQQAVLQLLVFFVENFDAGKWRAVGQDTVSLLPQESGLWAVTRVDFYELRGGKPDYNTSLLYQIWVPGSLGKKEPDFEEFRDKQFSQDLHRMVEVARDYFLNGPANLGGQVTPGRKR